MDAKTKSPQEGGLTLPGEWHYAWVAIERDGILRNRSGSVNNSVTPRSSGSLDGETTRRESLNPHRGGQPVGAQRVVGKRKWQSEQSDEM